MELAIAAIVYILIFSIGTICIIYSQYKHAKALKLAKIAEQLLVKNPTNELFDYPYPFEEELYNNELESYH